MSGNYETCTDQTLAALKQPTVAAAIANGSGKEAVTAIADAFDTSFELTLYRLQDLGLLPSTTQRAFTMG